MAIKSIQKYTSNRIKKLEKLLSKPIPRNSLNTFHQIRIEIKKLNALRRFLEYSNIKFLNKKTASILELIFSDSGNIRAIQVGLQLIRTAFPEMRTHDCVRILKKRLVIYQVEFTKKYSKILDMNKNSISKDIKIDKSLLTNYIVLLHESKHQIYKGPKERPSIIHKIRVNLKDAAYLSKWLHSDKSNKKDMKFILDLGIWHDLVSFRKLILKTLVKNEFNELETSQLVLVMQKINRSINHKLKQLNTIERNKKA